MFPSAIKTYKYTLSSMILFDWDLGGSLLGLRVYAARDTDSEKLSGGTGHSNNTAGAVACMPTHVT